MTKARFRKASPNIFADLGFEKPEEEATKVDLAYEIRAILIGRKLTQSSAAKLLGISQPDVSKLMNVRPYGFTLDRLFAVLTTLSRDIEIRVTKAPRSRRGGHIRATMGA